MGLIPRWVHRWGRQIRARAAGAKHVTASFLGDLDAGLIAAVALACGATAVCDVWDITVASASLPALLTLIAFPLTFSINEAYGRKQRTLESIAEFQSELWTLNAYHQHWRNKLEKEEAGLGDIHCAKVFDSTTALMLAIREYCVQERTVTRNVSLEKVYEFFRLLRDDNSWLCDRTRDLPDNINDVILFRTLSQALFAFERIRVARDYPTPRSARNTYKVLGFIYPAMLAPVYMSENYDDVETETWAPYYVATLVAIVFGLLVSVQDKLDNPFNTYEIPSSQGGSLREVLKHPDNIDLSKLVFWPMLAISGEIPMEKGATEVTRPACTLHGGPTPEVRELLRRRSSIGRHFSKAPIVLGTHALEVVPSRSSSPNRTRRQDIFTCFKPDESKAPPPPLNSDDVPSAGILLLASQEASDDVAPIYLQRVELARSDDRDLPLATAPPVSVASGGLVTDSDTDSLQDEPAERQTSQSRFTVTPARHSLLGMTAPDTEQMQTTPRHGGNGAPRTTTIGASHSSSTAPDHDPHAVRTAPQEVSIGVPQTNTAGPVLASQETPSDSPPRQVSFD